MAIGNSLVTSVKPSTYESTGVRTLDEGIYMNKLRSILYALAKLLGDINAVKKGKTTRRIGRRVAGKVTGKLFRKLFK